TIFVAKIVNHPLNFIQHFDDTGGKLGTTSTEFEEPCKKSASIIGIDRKDIGETASHLVYFFWKVLITFFVARLIESQDLVTADHSWEAQIDGRTGSRRHRSLQNR